MAEKVDDVGLLLEAGLDVKNRIIYFGTLDKDEGSEFTWKSVEMAVRGIHMLEQEAPGKPISLHMSSPGGDAESMLRLVDTILASSCQFRFYGSGLIASSATWIMAVCDERYLTPNTTVLIHDSPSTGERRTPMKLIDFNIEMDIENALQHRLNQMYADNSIMPIEFWAELVKRDMCLTAEETVLLGLADKVLEPRKRASVRKKRTAAMSAKRDPKEMAKLVRLLKDRIYSDKLSKLELRVPQEETDASMVAE